MLNALIEHLDCIYKSDGGLGLVELLEVNFSLKIKNWFELGGVSKREFVKCGKNYS